MLCVAYSSKPIEPKAVVITVPDDYLTIQEAINAASNGDSIFVRDSTYYEKINVNKSVSLIGENRETTIIDGRSAAGDIAINVSAYNIVIKNFTIYVNGWILGVSRNIILNGTVNTVIADNNIINNEFAPDPSIIVVSSTNITLTGNNITCDGAGMYLSNSSQVLIAQNNITNGTSTNSGIYLYKSFNNTIVDNRLTVFAGEGIALDESCNNTVTGNTITGYPDPHFGGYAGFGITLGRAYPGDNDSSYNTFSENYIENMGWVLKSFGYYNSHHNNVFSGNIMANNTYGVVLENSFNFTFKDNSLTGNTYNMRVYGDDLPHFYHDIDTSNTVNGKPIYYLMNQQNLTINKSTYPNIGYLALVNSTNILVENLELKENGEGLLMAYTRNSRITNNTFTKNSDGIFSWFSFNNNLTHNIVSNNKIAVRLRASFNNIVAYNSVTNNSRNGILLDYSFNSTLHSNNIANNSVESPWDASIYLYQSYTNTIFHNNFINNQRQVYNSNSWSIWDDGCEGNYWSNYNGSDLDSDGIGDAPYVIDGGNHDNHPLMGMFSSFNTSLGEHVNVVSNSTIAQFRYFEENKTITIYASNMTVNQTHGFCRVCIPHSLINATEGSIEVIINDGLTTVLNLNNTLDDNGTHRWIYFAYEHSTHKIDIIPELSSLIMLSLLMVAALPVAIVYRRKRIK